MNRRPIIIDTDPGIDDAVAIAIALFSDELDVRLITTVAGNVSLDKVTYNTLRLQMCIRDSDYYIRREQPRFQGGCSFCLEDE